MENIFLIGGIVSIIFIIFKFMEMRFIEKESKPLKYLIKETLLVYVCVILGLTILFHVQPLIIDGSNKINTLKVFTDNPGF